MDRERILVIDDMPDLLATLVDALERSGYAAVPADDCRTALRLLEGGGFDVIVSDIVLPWVSGLQFLEMARRLDPDVPVLLMTGYATREVALEALGKGAAGLLEKPFTTDQLLGALRTALARAHLRQDTRALSEPAAEPLTAR